MSITAKREVTNDAEELISISKPYRAEVSIQGTSDLLFHRWSCEDVEAKSKASKGSTAKKTDKDRLFSFLDKKICRYKYL